MTSHLIDRVLQEFVDKFEASEPTAPTTSIPAPATFAQEFIAGGLGAMCSRTLTSPLSVCQVNMQTSVGVPLPFRKAVQSIYHTTGPFGFWAGNSAALARIVPSAGLKFSLFRNLHDSNVSHSNVTLSAMGSGALAGIASVLVLHPIDVVKIQMVVRSTNVWPALGQYASTNVTIRDAAAKILREGGVLGFYRGLTINLIGVTLLEGSRFAAYETFKTWWKSRLQLQNKELHHGHYAVMGYVAGVISQGLTYPIDVVRRRVITSGAGEWKKSNTIGSGTGTVFEEQNRIKASASSSNLERINTNNNTARHVIRFMWNEESFKSFWRGAFINKLKNPLASAVTFTIYELVVGLFKDNTS